MSSAPPLVDAARRAVAGSGSPEGLLHALLTAELFCEAPERPGVVAARTPDGREVVCVHSSPAQLAAARGAVRWFATRGVDLLDQLPVGHDLLLDPASPHALLLRTAQLRRAVRVE